MREGLTLHIPNHSCFIIFCCIKTFCEASHSFWTYIFAYTIAFFSQSLSFKDIFRTFLVSTPPDQNVGSWSGLAMAPLLWNWRFFMNIEILTPGRTLWAPHPILDSTHNELSNLLLFMAIRLYVRTSFGISHFDKKMRFFSKSNLPLLEVMGTRLHAFHVSFRPFHLS